jgi:hypothetical protein
MGPHITELLSAFMDGELGARERAEVDLHLRACPPCARHLEELRAVDSAARALPLRVPDGYFEAFRGTLRERLPRGRPATRRLPPSWALAAAAAVVLALITPRLLRETRPPAVPAAPAPATPAAGTIGRPAATPPPAAPKKDTATAADSAATREGRAKPPAAKSAARAPGDRLASSAPPYAAPPPPAPLARETDSVQPLEDAAAPTEQGPAQAAPMLRAEAEPAAGAEEQKARRDEPPRGVGAGGSRATAENAGDARFDLLLRRPASSAGEARALRDAWRAYAQDQGEGARADEARVRVVELGAEAWRRGRQESDRAQAERDGREYLQRPDARQPARVREALRSLSP